MSEHLHQRAKEIFGKLVELPREEAAIELERLCEGDSQLKREVSSLLDFHTARSLMATPPKPKIRHRSTLNTTRLHKTWFQKAIAYLPIAAQLALLVAVLLPLLWYLSSSIAQHNQVLVAQQLEVLVSQRAEELKRWHVDWQSQLKLIVERPSVRSLLTDATDANTATGADNQSTARDATEIQRAVEEILASSATFCLWDKQMHRVAHTPIPSDTREIPGWTPFRCSDLMKAAGGEVIVKMPVSSQSTLPPPLKCDVATAFTPVRNDEGNVVGTLVIQTPAIDASFNKVTSAWRGQSDSKSFDTYVVDSTGHLISNLQYAERLNKLLDVIGDRSIGANSQSSKSRQDLLIRDPQVDLFGNEKPEAHASWPLTEAVQSIADSRSGSEVEGYRNYVGQQVVGSWVYLPEQLLGVVMELPLVEAFQFQRSANYLLGLLGGLCFIGTLIGVISSWPKRRIKDVQSVGPYKIQELLGEGGMGKVYLAEHSLLCRPTAIKILSGENADLSVLMRFEREVQLASQLTHPNTISIYDFGRNENGLFYYAMEYIDGGHLGQLVEFDGPLPAGRCIYLIRQLCFALREAHLAGVVHRDIKPQNVMLCDRGGEPDFIKLVDYGLVKAFAPGISDSTSQTNIIIGTPRFMAPERLQSPWLADPRVDIYSIGGLIYYMLTAELPPLVTPSDPSQPVHVGAETLCLNNVAKPFRNLLEQCISCNSSSRPSSIASLLIELDRLAIDFPWTRDDSERWWKQRGAKFKQFLATKRTQVNRSL